jgi:hypothetical protein
MKEIQMEKRVALFEVKALDEADPHGEFEAILSVPTIDRDGEVVDARCFEPLPTEIPIHKFHDFSSPVATAVPFYDGDVLKARGWFDPDPDSQAIRAKVGRSIRFMSVGFMAATRSDVDGVPHISKAELLEASFVSVPSNREAAVLAVKAQQDSDPAVLAALKAINDKLDALTTQVPAGPDPDQAAAPAAADPADVPVGKAPFLSAALEAEAALLLLD